MDAILKSLFTSLQDKLSDIKDDTGKNIFGIVDFDFGQLEDERPALSYPALLIDFSDVNWQQLAENCRTGDMLISIKLVFTPYSQTSNITNPTFKEKGLKYFELEKIVQSTLEGWTPNPPEVFSALTAEKVTTSKERTDLRIRVLTYSIGIDDYSNKKVRNKSNPNMLFNGEINT